VVADTVAAPIESQVNGVEDMLYMSSVSSNNGRYSLTVTFAVGTDPDLAAINVQNRVALATATLPEAVRAQGVTVRKRSSSTLMYVQLVSRGGATDQITLFNLMNAQIRDPIARLGGVGDAQVIGASDYAMRIWLKPDQMHALDITAGDIIASLRAQNVQASAGQIGGAPTPEGAERQLAVQARGRLTTVSEFEDVIVRTNLDGAVVRLGDVARVELGSQTYESISTLDNEPAATLAIYQSPGSNAIETAARVRAELARIGATLPDDVEIVVPYDLTHFVEATILEIEHTLVLTFAIVVIVVFLFLQDWRATLIPVMAIPVSLIATFAVLYALGFSANTISLFAIVLAITLVVDDAIVVVENVQRVMEEDETLSVPGAVTKAMAQITGPVIATTLVLAAVFVPVAFLPGITGELYRQFAVTIAVAVLFSGIVALTLTPALCVLLLRRERMKPIAALGFFEPALAGFSRGVCATASASSRRWASGFLF
jgi:hydrophobe/amphiphile efflux-1 (HAE1) family protein